MTRVRSLAEDRIFRWDRTPDPAWQAALDQAFPRASNGSGVVVRWQPGDLESPVQRWVVDQWLPVSQCYSMDFANGTRVPIPVMGHYLRELARNRAELPPWLARIHRVVQDHGCLPVPLWIVQGTDGGHPVTFGTVDRIWAQYRTGSADAPAPGSLPYADFDGRVVQGLVERDRWRGVWNSALAEAEGREEEAERRVRRLIDESTQASMAEVIERVAPSVLANAPRDGVEYDYQGEIDQYLETGEIASRAIPVTAP